MTKGVGTRAHFGARKLTCDFPNEEGGEFRTTTPQKPNLTTCPRTAQVKNSALWLHVSG